MKVFPPPIGLSRNPKSHKRAPRDVPRDIVVAALPFIYLDIEDLTQVLRRSKPPIYADIKAGLFPPPDHVGRRALWRSDVIAEHLQETSAKADAERETLARTAQARSQRAVLARQANRERRT